MKLTQMEADGKTRPARGPRGRGAFDKGVANGPLPTTERGIRRRKANMAGYTPPKEE